jgi:hypothetical protein
MTDGNDPMKKYFWQIVTTALAAAAIFAAYNVYYLSRQSKEVQIIVDSTSPLVSINPEASGHIQISYDGQLVTNVQLVQLRILNSGNQPIQTTDYSRPITISFSPDDKILDMSIINSEPSNIGMALSALTPYQANVLPVLLNSGDSVTIRFIVVETRTDPIVNHLHVDGRIVGIQQINLTSLPDTQSKTNVTLMYMAIISGLSTLVLAILTSSTILRSRPNKQEELLAEQIRMLKEFEDRRGH